MYILFDIGGTNMRFAKSKDLKTFSEPVIIPNSRIYHEDIVAIGDVVSELSNGEKIKGMAGGIAGTVDMETGELISAPNMKNWIGKPVYQDFRRMTGVSPIIVNDTDCGALGEAIFGAGNGYRSVAYMTVSTGVGGSLVIDGKPVDFKYSPEPGWQVINYDTKETLHDLAGGRELEEKYNQKPKELSPEIYQEVSHYLAVGVYNAILFWSPDIFVLGGSQMRDIDIDDLNQYVASLNVREVPMPEIVKAKLDSENGLFGAMQLLK